MSVLRRVKESQVLSGSGLRLPPKKYGKILARLVSYKVVRSRTNKCVITNDCFWRVSSDNHEQ